MTETAPKYISPRKQCNAEYKVLMDAMEAALNKPTGAEQLAAVTAIYQDPKHGLGKLKGGFGPQIDFEKSWEKSQLEVGREGIMSMDWKLVYETPTETALDIVRLADNNKSWQCTFKDARFQR